MTPNHLERYLATPAYRPDDGALPQDIEAEQAVLGSLLIDPHAIERVASFLRPDDFFLPVNAEIFGSMLALYEHNRPADTVILANHLQAQDRLDDVGGVAYLASLSALVPTSINVEYYARIVERLAVLRRLVEAGTRISAIGRDERYEADEALEEAERVLFDISRLRVTRDFEPLAEVLNQVYEKIDHIHNSDESITGVTTGFVDLDRLTSGLQRSDLVILAARPSMGKTSLALNIAHAIATKEKLPVGIFSIEMAAEQIAQRLMSLQSQVEMQRIRSGRMTDADWERLVHAVGQLSETPIFVDDTPGLSIVEMRSKARRLHAEQGLGLLIVDYLQLMQSTTTESRVQEISAISRALKGVARDLDIPVLALSQLSRAPEQRPNHEPMLSDHRESGCLTGDTMVYLSDQGTYRRIDELVGDAHHRVQALDTASWRMKECRISRAFSTGRKLVYRLTTRSGRTIRATANHQFLTIDGWHPLAQLQPGREIALPRRTINGLPPSMADAELSLLAHLIGDGCTLPRHAVQYVTTDPALARRVADDARALFGDRVVARIHEEPAAGRAVRYVDLAAAEHLTHSVRNPIAEWLRSLGVFGLRSWEKRVPNKVFAQPDSGVALFLRHLWATDGCVRLVERHAPAVYYATSSDGLARDVQSLLLRLGIMATLRRVAQSGKGRDQFHVAVTGKPDLLRFLDVVGTEGEQRTRHGGLIRHALEGTDANTNRDIIPKATWTSIVRPAMAEAGVTTRKLQGAIGTSYCGSTLYKSNFSRERATRVATAVASETLARLAQSDVYWDQVVSIEPGGEEEVFDLTIEGLHNFVANDIVVHNSIEQDADVVMFVYRDVIYNADTERPHVADIIVAKHRNGPTGKVHLFFQDSLMKFADLSIRDGD